MKSKIDYTLYLVTDHQLMSTKTLEEAVEQAIAGGCTLVQLREKTASSRDFYQNAINVKTITDKYNVPLIINDRIDIALAVGADGVHVGQSDLPAAVVRKIIGNDKILGVSAGSVEKAIEAQKIGADYIGVGALFSTSTKTDAKAVSIETLMKIVREVSIPVVGIGGINAENAVQLKNTGIRGIAVVSAIISQKDIKSSAEKLLEIFVNKA
ncbi:thiamine phosphate synthase [Ruminiclostridium cellulolyticum]|uniref:Thiamine-phosphate synthase n=1 Tax=Ruminiclostridium cellulolyticum (strain ATCC 35319 / DSM 5812 / JCM 6584 / H10) TaxID=394503 RepID=THIE_RUMCH|nr:thiamine phosphate synthase [Ruminiclostridium cellulolyticum]B8I3J4.1 RecName: Full=Thiamine-phosphate synthase; Short=TP synthase; Short=TPS; AltName: Full=Thiamine-phosphate pyrophosphorylase; Short=TMP pyrophosphorylase; Short=TMP-PPase [Ruminiclostridium cellulolyticum H10]ACL76337.1 thiamine-phosphate pyrophosphorylase [Ruminiclostridium cellulolyticum H10]